MSSFPKFPASSIPPEGLAVDVPLHAAWLKGLLGDTEVCPAESETPVGRFTGRLSRSGADVVVRAKFAAEVMVPCVRCLEAASVAVGAELSLLLEPVSRSRLRPQNDKGKKREPEYEFSAAEADLDCYDGEMVVLDPFLREAILLEIPNFPLCSEACPGIRPGPVGGQAMPMIDPRMAPLGAFRDKEAGPDRPTSAADLVAAAVARATALGKKPILRSSTRPGAKKKKNKK